jgi:hypothetical protein
MSKSITGQYEFLHHSGIGLDYFTSRIDRLTLLPNGRFILLIQERSRLSNAAQSLMNGQQIATNAPEIRREGTYNAQGNAISFRFDDEAIEDGLMAWNGEGMQFGPNFFNKVSDSTFLPPTHRTKKDMEDIAKGLKIASTLGGMAIKAAKTIQDTIQTAQEPGPGQKQYSPSSPPVGTAQPVPSAPVSPVSQPQQPAPSTPAHTSTPQPQAQGVTTPPQREEQGAIFCDQCGARARPGKRFCNNCGAQLP